MFRPILFILFTGLGFCLGGVKATGQEAYRAGAAKVDITPKSYGPMWGYAARGKNKATGIIAPALC